MTQRHRSNSGASSRNMRSLSLSKREGQTEWDKRVAAKTAVSYIIPTNVCLSFKGNSFFLCCDPSRPRPTPASCLSYTQNRVALRWQKEGVLRKKLPGCRKIVGNCRDMSQIVVTFAKIGKEFGLSLLLPAEEAGRFTLDQWP